LAELWNNMKAIIEKYYQPIILFLLTLTIASIFSVRGVDPHHQGIMFKPALDFAHGQMLFRDTFTQYGALTTLLHALALRIFGDYLIVIQIETAFFYALISVCLWYIWLSILPRWLTTISVLIWLFLAPYYIYVLMPWSSVPALFFQLLSLLLVLRALHNRNRLMMILAGGVAALTFWCRQPVGFFHGASMVFFLATSHLFTGQKWKDAITHCIFFIVGIVAVSVPFLVWLAFNGALHDMYLQSIKGAFFFGVQMPPDSLKSSNLFIRILTALFVYDTDSNTNYIIRFFDMPFIYRTWIILPFVCLSLFVILVIKRWRDRSGIDNHLPVYALLLVSFASWMQYYPVICVRHLYWAATPMIGLLVYGVWQLCKLCTVNKALQVLTVCLILTSLFKSYVEYNIFHARLKCTIYKTRIEEPRVLRGMYTTPSKAETYKNISTSLNNAIKTNSYHYLVNLSSNALYLTFIGPQNNFHPMYIDWGKYNDNIYPDFRNRTEEFINTKHPLVLNYENRNLPGWKCVNTFNETVEYERINGHTQYYKIALYRFTGNDETP
jgi:hypothetical protein